MAAPDLGGIPSVGLAIYQLSGSHALKVSKGVQLGADSIPVPAGLESDAGAGDRHPLVLMANQRMAQGATALQAAAESVRDRFQPILLTAISALFGFLPLVLASGVGSVSRSLRGRGAGWPTSCARWWPTPRRNGARARFPRAWC